MGSSGSSGGEIDKKYNARMAAIAESNQELAEEMMVYYREYGLPIEIMQAEAAEDLIPLQATYQKGLLSAGMEMMPYAQRAGRDYFNAAHEGVDRDQWAGRAATDVASGYKDAQAGLSRQAGRMGINPNSGMFADSMKDVGLSQARDVGTAKSQARQAADQEDFRRKSGAAQMGLGLGGM